MAPQFVLVPLEIEGLLENSGDRLSYYTNVTIFGAGDLLIIELEVPPGPEKERLHSVRQNSMVGDLWQAPQGGLAGKIESFWAEGPKIERI